MEKCHSLDLNLANPNQILGEVPQVLGRKGGGAECLDSFPSLSLAKSIQTSLTRRKRENERLLYFANSDM